LLDQIVTKKFSQSLDDNIEILTIGKMACPEYELVHKKNMGLLLYDIAHLKLRVAGMLRSINKDSAQVYYLTNDCVKDPD